MQITICEPGTAQPLAILTGDRNEILATAFDLIRANRKSQQQAAPIDAMSIPPMPKEPRGAPFDWAKNGKYALPFDVFLNHPHWSGEMLVKAGKRFSLIDGATLRADGREIVFTIMATCRYKELEFLIDGSDFIFIGNTRWVYAKGFYTYDEVVKFKNELQGAMYTATEKPDVMPHHLRCRGATPALEIVLKYHQAGTPPEDWLTVLPSGKCIFPGFPKPWLSHGTRIGETLSPNTLAQTIVADISTGKEYEVLKQKIEKGAAVAVLCYPGNSGDDGLFDIDYRSMPSYVVKLLPRQPQAGKPFNFDLLDPVKQDAARWNALLSCARLRILGTAKLGTGEDYQMLGIEFYSTHPTDVEIKNTNDRARVAMKEFADHMASLLASGKAT